MCCMSITRKCFPTRLFVAFVSLQTATLGVPKHSYKCSNLMDPLVKYSSQLNEYFEIYISTKLKEENTCKFILK